MFYWRYKQKFSKKFKCRLTIIFFLRIYYDYSYRGRVSDILSNFNSELFRLLPAASICLDTELLKLLRF